LTCGDRERSDYHMRNFWDLFLSHPIVDDLEDLVMKIFCVILYCNAREWYENLPNDRIITVEQFEETFLRRWGIQFEDNFSTTKNTQAYKEK
jgi:hypothetical protein